MEVVEEADIVAPVDKVYSYLLDFTRHSEWTTPGHRVQIVANSVGPTSVGSTFTSDGHQMGAQHDILSVTDLQPDQRIVYEATMKDGNTFRHTFELEPSGTGTRLRKRFQPLHLSLTSKLFLPLAKMITPRLMRGDIERIKAHMEQDVQA